MRAKIVRVVWVGTSSRTCLRIWSQGKGRAMMLLLILDLDGSHACMPLILLAPGRLYASRG
jgi:hypothetical protein